MLFHSNFRDLYILILTLLVHLDATSGSYKSIILKNGYNESASISIETYNLINFKDNNICFTNNNIESESSVQFSFDEYRYIFFSEEDNSNSINKIESEYRNTISRLAFDADLNRITLFASIPQKYKLNIFTILGGLIFKSDFDENGIAYLPALCTGTYIVTATGEEIINPIKITIK